MKKLLAATAALAFVAIASPSFAATGDGSTDGPYATYNWGGFYAGINGGYGWGVQEFDMPGISASYNANGAVLGGTLGFNIDSGDWIFGFETDFDWSDMRGGVGCGPALNCSSKLDSLGTARIRVGYDIGSLVGTGPLLVYGTGGFAYGESKLKQSGGAGENSDHKMVTGGAYGAGAEYAIDKNWSVKAEYLRVDIGSDDYELGGSPARGDIRPIDLARAGINYNF